MITGFYASLCGLLIIRLAFNVIKLRRKRRVPLGDGGHDDLFAAIRSHANAVEYIPITLLLMLVLELSGAFWWLIHIAGITLLTGRLLHANALKESDIPKRVTSIKITFYLIMALASLNIGYFAYNSYLSLVTQ